ncbi:polysaccharide pyruvyl transferase family protein [Bizionia argentinensis JUB59]|uniref:Polysaccharide pyruvyl transferase family protein n=1 Tax=Bizionia argentinensis JUB59 TaxID=1046627 RepID=G2EAT0_9FLAO|nr:polysaccharide pyruvyl transferase family protein [Bizionia argentinensis]EGV44414.2 polysaccharide pyruvyl transferase family protein [Bizionia argentinensis JUB59]
MKSFKTVRLFWWSEPHLMGKTNENYGDLIGKYLVEKINKKSVVWTHPKRWSFKDYFQPIYVTAGSIMAHVNSKCVVWGSGIIQKNQQVKKAKFLAVRGPQTRENLLAQGYNVTEVYGDPALLLPKYYNPDRVKIYKLGIVPHYADYEFVKSIYDDNLDVLIIDLMTTDIEATTDLFLKCERIISSSLHGIIVAHAYQIPAVWVAFSDKLFGDGIKFQDYFESVNLVCYVPENVHNWSDLQHVIQHFETFPNLPEEDHIKFLQDGLLKVCPFKAV